ncbi:hypothetical protein CN692_21925 [Bacillus sp. AFS002410]|uniref:hypothetical protein n=1 Tax=Bacillus sp. AFS002410 TaxID=2033481 RepID=UPI000BEFDF63|nr:hypothetical protein [Bacillus sp. AFS002410]PEJ52374.1 hypothetical protein CN692_21925 [Bacillus sp. AFS002410]
MKSTKIFVIFFAIIMIGIGIFIYQKSNSYPISKTNENKVEKISSSLLLVKADLKQLNQSNEKEKLAQKAMEDLGKLDELLENFKFKKTPDKGLILWINYAFASKDAYIMDVMNASDSDSKGNGEFAKQTLDYLNKGLKEMKNKHEKAYKYFKRNGYFKGFYNE